MNSTLKTVLIVLAVIAADRMIGLTNKVQSAAKVAAGSY